MRDSAAANTLGHYELHDSFAIMIHVVSIMSPGTKVWMVFHVPMLF